MDANHVKVEAADGRSATVAPEFAGFVRAVLDYGIDIVDVFPDEVDANCLSLVFFSEEDASSFADVVLSEFMIPCTAPGEKDPAMHGHIMFSRETLDGEEETGVTIFMDIRREILNPVGSMFALLAERHNVSAPTDASWDGNIMSVTPGMDGAVVGGRAMLALHSHSPHWVEHVWVKIVSVDGFSLTGEIEEDAKEMKNVKKGNPVRFFRHQILDSEGPRPADLN